ncbi:hypothetical protein Dimus_015261 [Dionaea muscipula]
MAEAATHSQVSTSPSNPPVDVAALVPPATTSVDALDDSQVLAPSHSNIAPPPHPYNTRLRIQIVKPWPSGEGGGGGLVASEGKTKVGVPCSSR